MDIESFSLCLSYMELIKPKSNHIDKIIPVAGTLLGTFFGYALNQFTSNRKESKAVKNKLLCCDEDIQRLKHALDKLICESIRIMGEINRHRRPTSHQLPAKLSAFYLSEHFIELAHKFSTNQRYWVHLLIENLDEMNSHLDMIINEKSHDLFILSAELVSTVGLAGTMHALCQSFQDDKKQFKNTPEEQLEALGLNPEEIAIFTSLSENAEENNRTLKL
ncbi:hypothetical protein SAMN05216487_2466 [Pseudomonas sp. UC 17F4]|uniref:hypothetical protein n=1 Tax=Pseudomonas sp. UC 17F4 TaxID=1855328 RepID=UPI00088168C4|nr:hypothetical protein [Pseudomonas sp. UC 17F4]SDQ55201.1 hypothetical protein SAMN05216487_2466 [Pseudomonas sp. UC 17F4]